MTFVAMTTFFPLHHLLSLKHGKPFGKPVIKENMQKSLIICNNIQKMVRLSEL